MLFLLPKYSLCGQDISALAPTVTPDSAKAPLIFIPESIFDFGEVEEGPDLKHVFKISNRGQSPLDLNSIITTDAVMVYKTPPQTHWDILPGGQGGITVIYHTMGRPGHATKMINFTTNDPLRPEIQFQISMTVVREVDVMPDKVYFYGIKHGEEHSTQVKLLGKRGMPLEVLSVESAGKMVSVSSTSYSEGEGSQKRYGATLNVTLPAAQPIGTIKDDLVIKTTNAKKPQLDVEVVGEIVGRVQWTPKIVYFGANQEQPVFVNITANPPQGFAVKSVSSVKHLCRPFLKTVTNPDGSVGFQLKITVLKDISKDSDGKDQVIVTTNDPETPQFSVDVQGSH